MGMKTALCCSRCGSCGLGTQEIARRAGLEKLMVGNTHPFGKDLP